MVIYKTVVAGHFTLTHTPHPIPPSHHLSTKQGEVKHKYDDTMMGLFAEVFCAMPLCATIDEKVGR